jgi:hypothetical protein
VRHHETDSLHSKGSSLARDLSELFVTGLLSLTHTTHRISYRSGIGTIYHQVCKTDEQDFRIIEFEPNRTVGVKTLPQSSPSFERRFILYEEGDTTLIRDQWKLDTGRPALLERLARGRVKSAVAENLTKLKELLEEGRVVLQDGRQVTL